MSLCLSCNCSAVPTKNTKETNSTDVILSSKVSSQESERRAGFMSRFQGASLLGSHSSDLSCAACLLHAAGRCVSAWLTSEAHQCHASAKCVLQRLYLDLSWRSQHFQRCCKNGTWKSKTFLVIWEWCSMLCSPKTSAAVILREGTFSCQWISIDYLIALW